MPSLHHRSYQRSQSTLPPTERAYRRAARELREFHRSRSLDVILEEDHHSLLMEESCGIAPPGAAGSMLKKKRAVLCLADLVNEHHHHQPPDDEEHEGSETTLEGDDQQDFAHHSDNSSSKELWGHFTIDSPAAEQAPPRRHTIPLPKSTRTIPSFGRS